MTATVAGVGAGFLQRYRRRRHLPYLPPPGWVLTTPTHLAGDHLAVFALDEMGKRNFVPVVLDADHPRDRALELLRPILVTVPGPLELRLTGDDEPLRQALAGYGFGLDRTQLGMCLRLDGADPPAGPLPVPAVTVTREVTDLEISELYNACFGLTLTTADAARMRAHGDEAANLFAVRESGVLAASLRLVLDTHADGTRYAFLRGLAVHPARRRASMPLLAALYRAARASAVDAGAAYCHMLVDRPTERSGRVMKGIYASLGFREDVMVYRMRQRPER